MGIPHLTQHLQPFGTKLVLPQNPANQENAIIDGPSLAYHVFYVCMSRRSGARNALEAFPTYQELGEAAVQWLEQIEQYGFQIKAIFFDGLLPPSKQDVRLSRLQNYTNQLVTFKALNKEDLPPRVGNAPSFKSDVLSSTPSSNRLKALPAPPFLVPAVIETVLASKYGSLVSVIPGEADAYCADSARLLGGMIFTSDSDLLVHDLGATGKVVLFRDLETIHLPSRGKCLKAQQYHPAAIAERFDLSDLVKLAFFMAQDNYRGFTENVRLAASTKENPNSAAFTEFAEQYGSLPKLSKLALEDEKSLDSSVTKVLSQLDPRISEIIHLVRLKENQDVSPALEGTAADNLDMYLPFIIDDPTRSSAWRSGVSIRNLAYSLLRLLNPKISQVTEFERKGTRISGTATTLLEVAELNESIKQCLETFHNDMLQHSTLSTPAKWRAIAIRFVCQSNLENDKPPPPTSDLNRLVIGSREGVLSWSFIQASAQMQSTLYSLRILSQTTQVVHAILVTNEVRTDILATLLDLNTFLSQLPNLSESMDESSGKTDSDTEVAKATVLGMLQSLGVNLESETGAKKKKKRKKKGEHTGERSPPGVAWKENNMFSNLA